MTGIEHSRGETELCRPNDGSGASSGQTTEPWLIRHGFEDQQTVDNLGLPGRKPWQTIPRAREGHFGASVIESTRPLMYPTNSPAEWTDNTLSLPGLSLA